jgi:hypothetical protein
MNVKYMSIMCRQNECYTGVHFYVIIYKYLDPSCLGQEESQSFHLHAGNKKGVSYLPITTPLLTGRNITRK